MVLENSGSNQSTFFVLFTFQKFCFASRVLFLCVRYFFDLWVEPRTSAGATYTMVPRIFRPS